MVPSLSTQVRPNFTSDLIGESPIFLAASYAGRRTKFAPVKSLDSSEFSDLKTL